MYTDGKTIWDATLTNFSHIAASLGGDSTTTQAVIIVPPAGPGGTDYHVFTVHSEESTDVADPVNHSTYRPGLGTITQIIPPHTVSDIISTTYNNTERLTAVSHADCENYWVILQDGESTNMHALLVDSDAPPTTVVTSTSNLRASGNWESGYMKLSPDGTVLAYADYVSGHVILLAFDNATGLFTDMHKVTDTGKCYGIEFSPDSKTLYISCKVQSNTENDVRAHTIANGTETRLSLPVISSGGYIFALQLAPNGKIYGKPGVGPYLLEIGKPNTPLTPAVVQNATYADGSVITVGTTQI